jgi:AGCS family alanine or glycine:cation symporter
VNFRNIPGMFAMIFADAFDFRSIFGGFSGSCMVYGIKRGLYSNEAGVGSAPNAAAAADVSHPVKQGLVQALSVYIDTILLCTATALMCLSTGVPFGEDVSGAPYVQNAISTVFGSIGPLFITGAMILFAFTTLLGNLYYTNNALNYLNGKKEPSKLFMRGYHLVCVLIIFVGAIMPATAVWALADITMGGMACINLPSCLALSGVAIAALKDYEEQRRAGHNPVFKAKHVGMDDSELDCWK